MNIGFYGVGLVQWEASRQACVVLSTAEGGLMSCLESMVRGDLLASLIQVVEGRKIMKYRAEDHLRGQHRRNRHLGKSRRSVEDPAFEVAGKCPEGTVKRW